MDHLKWLDFYLKISCFVFAFHTKLPCLLVPTACFCWSKLRKKHNKFSWTIDEQKLYYWNAFNIERTFFKCVCKFYRNVVHNDIYISDYNCCYSCMYFQKWTKVYFSCTVTTKEKHLNTFFFKIPINKSLWGWKISGQNKFNQGKEGNFKWDVKPHVGYLLTLQITF